MKNNEEQQLREENKRLRKLLKFALHDLRFVAPDAHPESEYDFCTVCHMPEWKHKSDCAGVLWKKEVEELLKS